MGTAVASTQKRHQIQSVRELLMAAKDQIALALPRHLTADRMIRVVLTAALRTPKLLECTKESLIRCVLECSQLGLEPDGILGDAYLIPFNNRKNGTVECQLLPGYKGLVNLARRSGDVSRIQAFTVHEADRFHVRYGSDPVIEHVPNFGIDDRGPMKYVYATAQLKDGASQWEIMSRREVDGIRRRSRAANDGPWVTDYEEMSKKTVVRRLCKMLPLSPEMRQALSIHDQVEMGVKPIEVIDVDHLPEIESADASELDRLAEKLDDRRTVPAAKDDSQAAPAAPAKPQRSRRKRADPEPAEVAQGDEPGDGAELTPVDDDGTLVGQEQLERIEQILDRMEMTRYQYTEMLNRFRVPALEKLTVAKANQLEDQLRADLSEG